MNWTEFTAMAVLGNNETYGAGGETRTLMSVTSPDFESGAYTNFATPAACGSSCQVILEAGSLSRQPKGHAFSRQVRVAKPPKRANKTALPASSKSVLPNANPCYTIAKPVEDWPLSVFTSPAYPLIVPRSTSSTRIDSNHDREKQPATPSDRR